ncbi:uncharacterized protein N7473_003692 [Penicillium subrubescens]|uniref:Uncharacterized protein n=1 Tax=Penicillium subrubescens TaxID=1316194 RepID=A0A1Q5TL05_9EURO|nr:uncharacterized protein N7473_003692 [Penicillium subrubescens]KAJ5906776.1 hypothetical protein N7473_003692 [Penicillium subrubescens]OKP00914.1 hypothetical protein PENSUB_7495 [Penicillium subrubescens]
MTIALTASAIIKGDCEELQRTIDAYDDPKYDPLGFLWEKSVRFGGIRPLSIAGLKGSTEAFRLLIANESKSRFRIRAYQDSVFNSAAKKGNTGTLKAWIEYSKSKDEDLPARVLGAVIHAVRTRRPDVAECIEKECGFQFDKSGVIFDMFMESVIKMRFSQVQLSLKRGGFDINMETDRFRYGPLHGAIWASKETPDLQLVTLLLEHGADPNKFNPMASLTPLQVAVKSGNVALAKLLIEHGADISDSRLFQTGKSRIPLIHVAVENRSAPMIRLLLENGLDTEYLYRGRRIEIREGTVEGGENEVRLQRKMQEVVKPIDEKGYVVLMGDKIDEKSKSSRDGTRREKDEY